MNIERTFNYPFKGENVFVKLLIGTVLNIIPFVGIGYSIRAIGDAIRDEDAVPPEWNDLVGDFLRGLVFTVMSFIYSLPSFVFLVGFIPLAIIDESGTLVTLYAVLCFMPLILLYSLIQVPMLAAATAHYAVTGDLGGAYFNIGARFREVFSNLTDTLMLFVIALVLSLVVGFLFSLTVWLCGLGFLLLWANNLMLARLVADYGRVIGAGGPPDKPKRGLSGGFV